MTPARLAAARANLEKARAAGKEKIYRPTPKRLAANRANLVKAQTARRRLLEQTVDSLDRAFPPLREQILRPAGSEAVDRPSGAGQSRQVADYPALEKVGRAILHRRRALLGEARREAQRVMRLLTEAAERTVAASLNDLLGLASGLIAVLAHPRLRERARRLNRRIERGLGAFLDQRYGEQALPWMAELGPKSRRRPRLQPRPQLQTPDAHQPPTSKAEGRATPPARASGQQAGPHLPPSLEAFQALVRRAFCAPNSEPEDETLGLVLDGLAETLWERLHLFEAALQKEAKALQDTFREMGQRPPDNAEDVVERCYGIESRLAPIELDLEEPLGTYLRQIRQDAGLVIEERCGLSPEIECFCRASA
jgi:hypothetical protein